MKDVINQLSPFLKGLVFTGGGEPLCNNFTIDAVIYAKQKGLDVGFITNGELITEKIAEKLVENCSWVRVSVDAADEKDYLLVHGKGRDSYKKVLEGIGFLINAKKKFGGNCTIGAAYLTNEKLSKGMFSFSKKMKQLGVDYVQFRPFHFDKFNVDSEIGECKKLENEDFKVEVSRMRYDKNEYEYPVAYRDYFTTVLAADGKLYPDCFTRGMRGYALGDLNHDIFEEIWNSEKKKEIIENKLKMKNCPVMCRYDSLSNLLWNIKQVNEGGKHLSFV